MQGVTTSPAGTGTILWQIPDTNDQPTNQCGVAAVR